LSAVDLAGGGGEKTIDETALSQMAEKTHLHDLVGQNMTGAGGERKGNGPPYPAYPATPPERQPRDAAAK